MWEAYSVLDTILSTLYIQASFSQAYKRMKYHYPHFTSKKLSLREVKELAQGHSDSICTRVCLHVITLLLGLSTKS